MPASTATCVETTANCPRETRHPSKRIDSADLLKGFAVLFMIQIHIVEVFTNPSTLDQNLKQTLYFLGGPTVAPTLMLLMGFFALNSRRTRLSLFIRGMKLFCLGLILNIGLNLNLLIQIYSGNISLNPLEYLLGVDILLLSGLSLMIIAALRQLLGDKPERWILASLIVVATSPLVADAFSTQSAWSWLTSFVATPTAWSYFPLFPWLAYPLIGAATGLIHQKYDFRKLLNVRVLAAGCLALLITGQFALEQTTSLPTYYHHGLALYLWNLIFIGTWALLWNLTNANHRFFREIAWFGKHITACYVVQWLIIGNIGTAIYQSETVLHSATWFITVVVFTRWLVMAWNRFIVSFGTQ